MSGVASHILRVGATLALAMVVGCSSRTLESCAAYLAILGPTVVTIRCPPPGFKGSEVTPEATVRVEEQ